MGQPTSPASSLQLPASKSRAREFASGVRAQLPLLVGVAPFGLSYGAYAASVVPADVALSMSVVVFGGASQFVGVRQWAEGVPALLIVLTAALVNLRHMLYSASMAPHLDHLPGRWRWLIAYLLTDEAYAMAIDRYRRPDASPHRHWFVLGTGLALWACWQLTTAAGVLLGRTVGDDWSLEFALPLTFTALLVPALNSRPAVAAACLAGAIAVLGRDWPYGTGLLTAIICGIAGALAVRMIAPGRPREVAP